MFSATEKTSGPSPGNREVSFSLPLYPSFRRRRTEASYNLGRSRKRRSVSASRPAAVTTRPKPRARHKAIRRESNRRSSAKQSVRRRPFPANSCPHITMPGLLRRKRAATLRSQPRCQFSAPKGQPLPTSAPIISSNSLVIICWARLVVLYRQFLQQLGRVIGSHLHRDRPRGVLGSVRVEQHREYLQTQHLRDQRPDHLLARRLDDVVGGHPFRLGGLDLQRQILFATENLRGRALEMIIDQLDTVDLALGIHSHQPLGQLRRLPVGRTLGQRLVVSLRDIACLADRLGNFLPDRKTKPSLCRATGIRSASRRASGPRWR